MARKKLITHSVRFGKDPTVGDFVLAFDELWIIRKIDRRGRIAHVENWASGEIEEFFIGTMESTDIRTWELE